MEFYTHMHLYSHPDRKPRPSAGPQRAQIESAPLLIGLTILLVGAAAHQARAEEAALPDPLKLEQALELGASHPRLAQSEQQGEDQRPPPFYIGCHDLAFAGARDGGPTRNHAWDSPLIGAEAAQRLEIMQRFFDVLLADLSFARDNEAMAVAYVQLDRARVRAELGQFSPLRVAELDAQYQQIRRQRAASEASQRLTRARLAQALGRPESLPSQLELPTLPAEDLSVPSLESVVQNANAKNPHIRAAASAEPNEDAQALLQMEIEGRALELITRLELLGLIAEQTESEAHWRDLKLDESRTLYELEAKADLGFSMSQQTRAKRDQEQVALCQVLTLGELNALQGEKVQ